MIHREGYKRKLFLYYFSIFLFFTGAILVFQYHREKDIRIAALDSRLNDMTGLVQNYIRANNLFEDNNLRKTDSIFHLIPVSDLRITIIDVNGIVIYDSSVGEWSDMENHLHRPEVSESHYSQYGTSVRKSGSTGKEYYYFSKYFDKYYIRLAEEYNINLKGFLEREKVFLLFIAFIFLIVWGLLSAVTKKLGEGVTMLRNFAARMRRGEGNDPSIIFPDNELGETGKEIVKIYNNLVKNTQELTLQKEKLFRHLHVLNEGVAFCSPDRKITLSNNHFIVFLSALTGEHSLTQDNFLELPQFAKVRSFLDNHQNIPAISSETPTIEYQVDETGKYFLIRTILFNDKSFEVVINDITRAEQAKEMRQQMTANIAHELKTPVASIRGYLETLLVQNNLDEEQKHHFVEKALTQASRLTDLINDIVTLNKLDEASSTFTFEEVDVSLLVKEVSESFQTALTKRKIRLETSVPEGTIVMANRSLIFSVFHNLMENAINYGGEGISIIIRLIPGETGYYNFSFADTGRGIPEEHQGRIFERFYRVDDGRSRRSGGTGLGLSIVKNAILLHKGNISVRTRPGGGTEFTFYLPV